MFLPLRASFRLKGFHERIVGGLRNCPYRERWVSNIAALGEGVEEPARIVADVKGDPQSEPPCPPPKSLP